MESENRNSLLPRNHISYYEVLDITKDSTTQDIKSAYHKLLLSHHPDKIKQRERFDEEGSQILRHNIQNIQLAYKTLVDPIKRKQYDLDIHSHFIKLGLVNNTNTNNLDVDGIDRIDLSEFDQESDDDGNICFVHSCPRCMIADGFILSEDDLEEGAHNTDTTDYQLLVQCGSCSLWLCITYSMT